MDGARFAGAVAGLGVSPADITWRAGVDVLSFGGTKNGCIAAEAVVFFDPEHAPHFGYARSAPARASPRTGSSRRSSTPTSATTTGWSLRATPTRWARSWRRHPGIGHGATGDRAGGERDFYRDFKGVRRKAQTRRSRILSLAGSLVAPDRRPREDEVLVRLVTSWQTAAEEVERFAGFFRPAEASQKGRPVSGAPFSSGRFL
jgi:threonine aldolase